MSKLNFKEASLLDASGELSRPARRKLMDRIFGDSAAQKEYQAAQENFALLQSLPIPEASALQRQLIPATIKKALHRALHQHEKQAAAGLRGPQTLIRYASIGLALAACAAICLSLLLVQRAQDARLRDQAARINALIDRVASLSGEWAGSGGTDQSALPYDQAVTDVAASIRQLQTESPTLADLHDKGMANLLNALAALPAEAMPGGGDVEDADYSAPPGSY